MTTEERVNLHADRDQLEQDRRSSIVNGWAVMPGQYHSCRHIQDTRMKVMKRECT